MIKKHELCSQAKHLAPEQQQAIRDQAHNQCEECDLPFDNQERGEFHYTYVDDLDSSRDEVELLCHDCHHGRHYDLNGDFWDSEQEKESHWYYYWKEMELG